VGSEQCAGYDDDTDDAMLKAARAMIALAIAAAAAGGTLVLFEFVCCKIVCCASCVEGLAYLAAQVCSGLAFLAYGSEFCNLAIGTSTDTPIESSCSFGKGATYNVLALACYLASGIVLACSPKPTPLLHK